MQAALVLWLLTGCGCGETETVVPPEPAPAEPIVDERPNVLFIVWDTVRADHLSLYGYDKPTTPRLGQFAERATVYERATSPGMWTLPAHAAIFTGLPGTTHGANAKHRWLDGHHETLAEILNGSGYQTFGVSTNLIASQMSNLAQGFDTFETTFPRGAKGRSGRYSRAAKAATTAKLLPRDASTEMSPKFAGNADEKWAKAIYKDAAPVLRKALVQFVDKRQSEKPWFAYLNMMEAHTPRVPTEAARHKVMNGASVELGLATDASLAASNAFIVGKNTYSADELIAINGVYDATLIDLDNATGNLLDDLEERGILHDTLVIIVSDHGESLGEHQLLEHRWSMYDALLHVPLVIRWPGQSEGVRIPDRVSTIDLFATVLDAAGVQVPDNPGIRSKSLRNREYDPIVYSEMLDPFASQMKNVKARWPDHDVTPWLRTYDVAYEGDHKLLRACDGQAEVFDVSADPLELAPMADPSRATSLGKAFDAWRSDLVPYDPSKRAPDDGARKQADEEVAMQRALGYVEDDGEILAHPCASGE